MPFLLPSFCLAQVPPVAVSKEVVQRQEVRALPGELDTFPVFNSNSPEAIQADGILLSTFPPRGKRVSAAHLNFPFQGRFDLFAQHVAKPQSSQDARPLYLGIILHNPERHSVKVLVLQATSYLSQSQAPFIQLPSQMENPFGKFYAGPGSRVTSDVLRRQVQSGWPVSLVIPPGKSQMLLNLPIPTFPSNGRTTWMRLWSNGKVYIASLAMFAQPGSQGKLRAPVLEEWQTLLDTGDLAKPRDRTPTPPGKVTGEFTYGRVAGVSQGSQWQAEVTDNPQASQLSIPQRGQAFSYGINTLDHGTLGTGQVQSAPLLVRYPDTAYRAHGNYGVKYSLTLPLYNNTKQPQTVSLAIQTPIKENQLSKGGLRFLNPPARQVFFRGTVQLRYTDDKGAPQIRYLHLVQQRGEQGKPLIMLEIPPGKRRSVEVGFLYPPDSTPPQVLTVQTLNDANFKQASQIDPPH
jgi:hypothetical protein